MTIRTRSFSIESGQIWQKPDNSAWHVTPDDCGEGKFRLIRCAWNDTPQDYRWVFPRTEKDVVETDISWFVGARLLKKPYQVPIKNPYRVLDLDTAQTYIREMVLALGGELGCDPVALAEDIGDKLREQGPEWAGGLDLHPSSHDPQKAPQLDAEGRKQVEELRRRETASRSSAAAHEVKRTP